MKKHSSIDFSVLAMPIGAVFIVIAIILLIWFFLRGQTTGNGEYPAPVTTSSITCNGNNIQYPFFSEKAYDRNVLETDVVLGENEIRSISLKYLFYYDDQEAIRHADAVLRADMNLSFASAGLGADALGAHYSKMQDGLKFSLMMSGDEITNSSLKYFLVDGLASFSENSVKKYYESIGLSCSDR